MRVLTLAFLASGAALLAACDRPVVGPDAPTIEVVSPDLDEVQRSQRAELAISARALRGVERLTVNGVDASFDDASGLWRLSVPLASGADILVLEAFTADGATAVDTAAVVSLPLSVSLPVPALPEARAGHTATRTLRGIALAGGVTDGSRVLGTARRITKSGFTFSFGDPIPLQSARTGHSGTRLSDDRVLLLGGTSQVTPENASGFVATPEALDLSAGVSRSVVMRGEPFRRTGHAVTLLDDGGRSLLAVLGGRAPGAGGQLFTPSTVEFFEFREGVAADTLVRLSPAGGASGPGAFADPAQIPLGMGLRRAEALLVGLASGGPDAFALRYEAPGFATPIGVEAGVPEPPATPRTAAAGANLGTGLALIVGGRDASGRPLASLEAYAERAGRFFRFPDGVALARPRYEHAVTLAPSGRILVLGGRDDSGLPTQTLEVIAF